MDEIDGQLLARWANGRDARAFTDIVNRYADMVYGTCSRILRNAADAEEVTQDCFMTLAESTPSIRSSVGGWLHTLATRRCLDRVRSTASRNIREARYADARPGAAVPPVDDLVEHVDAAIESLPEHLRQPVVWYFLEQMPQREIAHRLGVSPPAVSQRIDRAVGAIRENLKAKGVPLTSSALAALFTADVSAAAPPSVYAALGRLAIAGRPGPLVAGKIGTPSLLNVLIKEGSLFMVRKSVVGIAVAAFVFTGYLGWRVYSQRPAPPEPLPLATHSAPDDDNAAMGEPREAANFDRPAEAFPSSPPDTNGKVLDMASLLNAILSPDGAGLPAGVPLKSRDIDTGNAMHYFVLAAELLPDVDPAWLAEQIRNARKNGWSESPELVALLAGAQDAFAAIRKGLELGNAMLPLNDDIATAAPYLNEWETLASLLDLEALRFEFEEEYSLAFDNYLTLASFSAQASHGGTIVHGLSSYDAAGRALIDARRILDRGSLTADEQRRAMDGLARLDAVVMSTGDMLVGELETLAAWMEEQPDGAAGVRNALADSFPNDRFAGASQSGSMLDALSDEEVTQHVRDLVNAYETIAGRASLPFPEVHGTWAESLSSDNPLTATLAPNLERLTIAEAEMHADVRGTLVAAAVDLYHEENGQYPESLEALTPHYLPSIPTDPFTEQPFGYRTSQNGYDLYSAGPDMEDNGGAAGLTIGTAIVDERTAQAIGSFVPRVTVPQPGTDIVFNGGQPAVPSGQVHLGADGEGLSIIVDVQTAENGGGQSEPLVTVP